MPKAPIQVIYVFSLLFINVSIDGYSIKSPTRRSIVRGIITIVVIIIIVVDIDNV